MGADSLTATYSANGGGGSGGGGGVSRLMTASRASSALFGHAHADWCGGGGGGGVELPVQLPSDMHMQIGAQGESGGGGGVELSIWLLLDIHRIAGRWWGWGWGGTGATTWVLGP